METKEVVIVSACRTAIGKFLGEFKNVSARDLAITVGKEAIKRAGIDPKQVDEIVMGEVYTGMQGSLPARQVSMRIGMDETSNAVNVNQNCASGMRALEIACNDVQLGKTEIGLVIGTENMTQAPFLLPKARMGYRMGSIPQAGAAEMYDSLLHDALYDELSGGHMGSTADNVAKLYNITREECDELAVMSHSRAAKATAEGKFKDEIIPVVEHTRKGDVVHETDEHIIPDCNLETISKLRTVFNKDGVTTAANASGINDAAAAVIIMSKEKAEELGIKPMAKMLYICGKGVDASVMGLGPAVSIPKCLDAAGVKFEDVDYWEINEAFAAQFIGCERKLKEDHGYIVDRNKTNLNGSGISLGHPVGCSALRIIVTLLYEMQRQDAKIGCASLCVGGGPSMASLWTREI
ncbi:thiolase family protein [Catenisphaera adipataccumulans]|jgi:acetyl-CoA C-acetyltransferase|uniref:acetyl-CoA C-acetyltransferase n=1 Tax=Catenisphaera adipataccumulans TaxID=700500 RepID=A0A7W8CX66_9FIRM|nr:thiolase family protein [Catenisphaera adipataccumulans]MBB5183270.1 acetyl-CoA C-acetyltransferase [Catenisphaera adipataccumulans]